VRRPDVSVLDVSPRGSNRFGVPDPTVEEGKESRPCLAPASVLTVVPKDGDSPATVASNPKAGARRAARPSPKGGTSPPRSAPMHPRRNTSRPHPTSGPEGSGMPVDPPRGENPPRRSAHPKALGVRQSRRLPKEAIATQRAFRRTQPVVRAPPFLPSAVARVHEGGLLAARSRSPEGDPSHARRSRVASRGRCVEPTRRTPEGIHRAGEPGATRRWSLADSRLRTLQQAGGRSRARQSSTSPERPGRDPKTGPSPRPEGRRADAEAPGVRLVPHIPPAGGDPPRAPECSCRDGPWPIPGDPDRSRSRFFSAGAEALSEIRSA
jgi:hypothetical protein